MIRQSDIEKILAATDMLNLAQRYLPHGLKRIGIQYQGLCIFHKETTPSFTVNPRTGLWYCHGCRAGGNAISFIVLAEHISFPAACRLLADRAGIVLDDSRDNAAREAYIAMIAAEAAWWWRRVARLYRDREMARSRFFEIYRSQSLNSDFDAETRFFFHRNAVRCCLSESRWSRICQRFESLDRKIIIKKYYRYRQRHPEVVNQFRAELELDTACGQLWKDAIAAVPDLFEENFDELIELIGKRISPVNQPLT